MPSHTLIWNKLDASRSQIAGSLRDRSCEPGRALHAPRYNRRMREADTALLKQLSENSTPYRDPLTRVEWDRLDTEGCWLPEPALSLYGSPEYETFSPALRRRLSQYEFINVLHCGLWLESVFLQRLTGKLHPATPRPERQYLLHELREEAGHSLMFLRIIEASGLPLPDGAWRAPRLTAALGRWLPLEGDVFWLAMVIGEHVPDRLNRWLRRQGDALDPAVRQICTLHVVDEARHITFARKRLEERLRDKGPIGKMALATIARVLVAQLADVLYFPPAAFYELAGLSGGSAWRQVALKNPVRRRFIAERMAPTLRLLQGYGLRQAAAARTDSAA